MTEYKLWAFVHRADTKEKILLAEKYLKDHIEKIGVDLYDDLMIYLSQIWRSISAEEEGREYHI